MSLLDAVPQPQGGPTICGLPMNQFSLATLTLQNSILILIMHYSRIMPPAGDHKYFTSTAVFLNEVIKLAIALTFAIYDVSRSLAPQTPATVLFEQIYHSVFSGDGWTLAIPATLYTFQNTLQYAAVGNLDPVHFQILYQLKILTTAFFSVVLLGRTLGTHRWMALVMLTVGVSFVSLPVANSADPPLVIHDTADHFFPRSVHELGHLGTGMGYVANELTKRALDTSSQLVNALAKRSASYEGINEDQEIGPVMNYPVGLATVLVAAVVSGLTGVYFEKVLKESATPTSVWIRNIQLSFYSLFPSLIIGVILKDGREIAQHGFFDGYNWTVWAVIVFQAIGGILASLCINYADNIAKVFATSISIVLSFLFSVVFFGFTVSFTFILGTLLVLFSTYAYYDADRKRSRPPPISIVNYEKTTIDSTPRIPQEAFLSLDPLDSARSLGLSTSRPTTPSLQRASSLRGKKWDE